MICEWEPRDVQMAHMSRAEPRAHANALSTQFFSSRPR